MSYEFIHHIYKYLSSRLSPEKYAQIDAFYERLISIHVGLDLVNPTFYPYLYQPGVEFALMFFVHKLFNKGYDHYPLCKAVRNYFNTETVKRRDGSQTTGILLFGIKNWEYVLNLCLEGQFIKQNPVGNEKLHETITLISNGDTDCMWFFIHLVIAEIFLKLWEQMSL